MLQVKLGVKPLKKMLKAVGIVAQQKSLCPVLENVRVTVRNREVMFRATDSRVALTCIFPPDGVSIEQEGEVLLSAVQLQKYVKDLPDQEIFLEQQGYNAHLTSQDGKFCILGEAPEKFPDIPEFPQEADIEIAGEEFRRLIQNTIFATTNDKGRYDLDNILVVITKEVVRFVATDGKRLALCEKPYKALTEAEDRSFTVPAKSFQQIEKILNTLMPAKIHLHIHENQLLMRTDDLVVSTRLSDVKFPPYKRVIPKDLKYKATVSRKGFMEALKRVSQMLKKDDRIIEVAWESNQVKLFSMGDGTGEASVSMPASFDGKPFQIKFNPDYLLDATKVVSGSEINVSLQDARSAMVIEDDSGFQCVVLPIRIEEKKERG